MAELAELLGRLGMVETVEVTSRQAVLDLAAETVLSMHLAIQMEQILIFMEVVAEAQATPAL